MSYLRLGSVASVSKDVAAGALDYISTFGVSFLDVPAVLGASTKTPDTTKTDPTKHAMLVRALQTGLSRAGFSLAPDGRMGSQTDAAARQVGGMDWKTKPWGVLFGLILFKIKTTKPVSPVESAVETVKSNLPIIAVGAAALVGVFFIMRRK